MHFSLYLFGFALPLSALARDGTHRVPMKSVRRGVSRESTKSTGPFTATLANAIVDYLVEVEVGTPPQKVRSLVDTGSSDLWLPAPSQCPNTTICPNGFFDPNQSSTFVDVAPGDFNISYAGGNGAAGDYFCDTLTVAGTTLTGFTMALASEVTGSTEIFSIMGISYPALESSNDGRRYPNYPMALVEQGVINTIAYSLWLDDLSASTGSILFGGIDIAKFCGVLEVVDFQNVTMGYFYVNLNLLAVSSSSGTSIISTTTALALLDSGTSLTLVPQDVMQAILSVFSDAQYDSQAGFYTIPCSDSSNEGYFTFVFGFAAIKVSLAEFIVPVGNGICALGFLPSGDATYILGDTFLRSAYVVYDMVNNQAGLAQSSFTVDASDVIAFPSYGSRIPKYFGTGSCSSTSTSASDTA